MSVGLADGARADFRRAARLYRFSGEARSVPGRCYRTRSPASNHAMVGRLGGLPSSPSAKVVIGPRGGFTPSSFRTLVVGGTRGGLPSSPNASVVTCPGGNTIWGGLPSSPSACVVNCPGGRFGRCGFAGGRAVRSEAIELAVGRISVLATAAHRRSNHSRRESRCEESVGSFLVWGTGAPTASDSHPGRFSASKG